MSVIHIEIGHGVHADEADDLYDAIADVVYGRFADLDLLIFLGDAT